MVKNMRTVDDVIRDYEVMAAGRTRFVGQEPRSDELLVEEIKRLRNQIEMMKTNCIGQCDTSHLPWIY